jgi:cell division FtsZ-interacting protein ZapD
VKLEFFDDMNEQQLQINDWYDVLTSEQRFVNVVIDNLAHACDNLLKYKISLMFDDYVAEMRNELNRWKKD